MENTFEMLLIIGLSVLGGLLLGTIVTIFTVGKENKSLKEELDKFRELYFNEVDKWKDLYISDDPCDKFNSLDKFKREHFPGITNGYSQALGDDEILELKEKGIEL